MPEAIVHVTFKGHDVLRHAMIDGSNQEAAAIAADVHDTYTRLLRTGLGTLSNITIDIAVYVNGERVVKIT